jgi:hypothetical protein
VVLGLRWSAARPWGTAGPLWWDLFFQELLGRPADAFDPDASSEAIAEKLRRIRAGLRWRGQTVSAEVLIRERSAGGLIASSAKRSRASRCNLGGPISPGWRWDLRAEETRQWWSAAEADQRQGQEVSERDQWVWRFRLHLERRSRIARGRGLTGGEAGAQQRVSRSAGGTERRVFSPWWGFYCAGRCLRICNWSVGLLEARSPQGSSLSVAPVWAGGTRFSLSGRGLYGAGAARCRWGPCRLRLRVVWPCWRETPERPGAGAAAEFSMQMGASGG